MSTAFPITYPRRVALSAGLKLINWARRSVVPAKDRNQVALNRRNAQFRRLARDQRVAEQREREIARYLYEVRPMI
ncbi:MAG: hypothetical protein L0I80_07570 [Brevibacterium sp.]|uniref:hypothetical protein n=1 Tax=Brevibacterium sp. TaxID=1701 RepID=UPI002649A175|nr:hypothetical protein [Brevibacterium sp.]MDN5806125.1 hypothetical protein [Brevibacterium sp.]MDN5832633.1 hypothetical protein [Brevibacterium sp.]MDN5875505.1 hypothetical protein [Brevibacterium sp.]MDN5908457.1 hypothetical protein [Brevibacterium sp.]MDN6123715.1 hypothetical protein [Brevibacterium sp.]